MEIRFREHVVPAPLKRVGFLRGCGYRHSVSVGQFFLLSRGDSPAADPCFRDLHRGPRLEKATMSGTISQIEAGRVGVVGRFWWYGYFSGFAIALRSVLFPTVKKGTG